MGFISFFDEQISLDNEPRVRVTPHQVEVTDNNGVPQLILGPVGAAYQGDIATFRDRAQFDGIACKACTVDASRKMPNQSLPQDGVADHFLGLVNR